MNINERKGQGDELRTMSGRREQDYPSFINVIMVSIDEFCCNFRTGQQNMNLDLFIDGKKSTVCIPPANDLSTFPTLG